MSTYTLHQLPDGTGVVIERESPLGPVTSGQAGFSAADVAEAIRLSTDDDSPALQDWQHLTLTQESAAFVAASYPVVVG